MSKLHILERQLAKAGGRDTGESHLSEMTLAAIHAAVEEDFQDRVKAAERKQRAAEDEAAKLKKHVTDNSELRKQVADLHREILNIQTGASVKMDALRSASKQEMEKACNGYLAELKITQGKIEALQTELVQVREARMRAETQKESMEVMCSSLKETIAQLRSVKPPVATPAHAKQEPRPLAKFKVTQRDELGRIVSIEQTA